MFLGSESFRQPDNIPALYPAAAVQSPRDRGHLRKTERVVARSVRVQLARRPL